MKTSDFLLWPNANQTPYACVLGDVKGLSAKDLYAIWGGKPMQGVLREDVEFAMSPDFPDNTMLSDNLMNKHQLIVGSEAMKQFLEKEGISKLEFLPAAVRDHKGKVAGQFYVVNPLDAVDCLNREASGALVSPSLKTHVIKVKQLVLHEEALPEDRPLFRVAGFAGARLVHRDLAAKLEKQFAGIEFQSIQRKAA